MRTVLALSMFVVAAASQAMMIDDFTDGSSMLTITNLDSASFETAATVAGGFRMTSGFIISNPLVLNGTVAVHAGQFAVGTDPRVEMVGGTAYGSYTADAGDLNLDLSADNAFSVDVLFSDDTAQVSMQVMSSTNGTSALVSQLVGSSPGTVSFAFSDFGIAMNDVDGIKLIVRGAPSEDIILDNLQTTSVPEPATLVFGFAAITALAAKRRRK